MTFEANCGSGHDGSMWWDNPRPTSVQYANCYDTCDVACKLFGALTYLGTVPLITKDTLKCTFGGHT